MSAAIEKSLPKINAKQGKNLRKSRKTKIDTNPAKQQAIEFAPAYERSITLKSSIQDQKNLAEQKYQIFLNCKKAEKTATLYRKSRSQNSIFEMLKFSKFLPNHDKQICLKASDISQAIGQESKSPVSFTQINLSKMASKDQDKRHKKSQSGSYPYPTSIRQGTYTIAGCDYLVEWSTKDKCAKVVCGTKEIDLTRLIDLIKRFDYVFNAN